MNISVYKRTNNREGLSTALLTGIAIILFSIMPAHAQDIESVIVELAARTNDPVGYVTARDVAVDETGNRFVFGTFGGEVEFGQGSAGQRLEGTFSDMFVAKYDQAGVLQWIQELESRFIFDNGGQASALPVGIALDQNDLYVTGNFMNTLDIGPETLVTKDHSADVFVAQLDPATGDVRWVNQIKSKGSQVIVRDISAARGNVLITGRFDGKSEFLGQFESKETLVSLSKNGTDMFAAKYSFGGILAFVVQAGGDSAEGLGIDTFTGFGNFTVAGEFSGTITVPGSSSNPTVTLSSAGKSDGFIAEYTRSGTVRSDKLLQIGGPSSDSAARVVKANRGLDTYVAGRFRDTVTIGNKTLTSQGETDSYLMKINLLGHVEQVVQIGSNGNDVLRDLDADPAGNAYIAGEFDGQELTIDEGASAIHLSKIQPKTPYFAGLSRQMIPLFAQTSQGNVQQNRITVDSGGTIHLATEYTGTAVFGEGDQTIELPAPVNGKGMAVARYTQGE